MGTQLWRTIHGGQVEPSNVNAVGIWFYAYNTQRYLLTDSIGDSDNTDAADSWGNLVASANDIVQYNGSSWFVHFDASTTETTEYVTNLNTSLQYKWDSNQWVRSYEGLYTGGKWSLVI